MMSGRIPRDVNERFWEKVQTGHQDNCWEWKAGLTTYGYGKFKIKLNGKWRSMNAHRVAWLLTCGPIKPGLEVCHTCDNRKCCNPKHLFLGTKQDNHKDMVRKHRNARGERNGKAKLTKDQVKTIRIRCAIYREAWESLANEYGVTKRAIRNIIRGKSWKHIS
jgi:hypothetical protein